MEYEQACPAKGYDEKEMAARDRGEDVDPWFCEKELGHDGEHGFDMEHSGVVGEVTWF